MKKKTRQPPQVPKRHTTEQDPLRKQERGGTTLPACINQRITRRGKDGPRQTLEELEGLLLALKLKCIAIVQHHTKESLRKEKLLSGAVSRVKEHGACPPHPCRCIFSARSQA